MLWRWLRQESTVEEITSAQRKQSGSQWLLSVFVDRSRMRRFLIYLQTYLLYSKQFLCYASSESTDGHMPLSIFSELFSLVYTFEPRCSISFEHSHFRIECSRSYHIQRIPRQSTTGLELTWYGGGTVYVSNLPPASSTLVLLVIKSLLCHRLYDGASKIL